MKMKLILMSSLLALAGLTPLAQASPLTTESHRRVTEWRAEVLPGTDAPKYWETLKELGGQISESEATAIAKSGASDADSALALMAYRVWSQPEKVDEIAGWYGVLERHVARELRGIKNDEHWARIRAMLNAEHAPIVERLREEHKQAEFLPAWEAWMLSPYSREREMMRERVNEALSAIGNDRTISILVEKYRILPNQYPQGYRPDGRQKTIQDELGGVRSLIREIVGRNIVSSLLECVRLAEAHGEAGQGGEMVRRTTVRALTSQINPDYLARNPEFADSVRDPNNPKAYMPTDNKWKEFKPIIEAMLRDPKNLSAEDIRLLKEALAAMPKK